jgi:hypothetical protein
MAIVGISASEVSGFIHPCSSKERDMRKIVLAGLCVGMLAFATNAAAWSVAYAHDENGVALSGNPQRLIDAIHAGKQVRFAIEDGANYAVFDAQTVVVTNGIVFAQNTSHVGWDGRADGSVVFNPLGYYAFYGVSTQGYVTVSRWYVGEHSSAGDTYQRLRVTWFVQ